MVDALGWRELATGGLAALGGLIAFTVNTFSRRLDTHEKDDKEKFEKLFDGQSAIANKIADGFRELDGTIHRVHIELLEQISERSPRP